VPHRPQTPAIYAGLAAIGAAIFAAGLLTPLGIRLPRCCRAGGAPAGPWL
jgi:hypothetical protein